MEDVNKEHIDPKEQATEPSPKPTLADGDVYFFNPWDKWIDEDFKPKLNSFDF